MNQILIINTLKSNILFYRIFFYILMVKKLTKHVKIINSAHLFFLMSHGVKIFILKSLYNELTISIKI